MLSRIPIVCQYLLSSKNEDEEPCFQKKFGFTKKILPIPNYFLCILDVPMLVEFTIHVRPLAKLEVLGLKTELTAGSDPVPFGVAGYDAEENEFDTLDGLQITW